MEYDGNNIETPPNEMVFCMECNHRNGSTRGDIKCNHPRVITYAKDWYKRVKVYGKCCELNANNDCKMFERRSQTSTNFGMYSR